MEKTLRNSVAVAVALIAGILTAIFGIDREPEALRVGTPYEISATQNIMYTMNGGKPRHLDDTLNLTRRLLRLHDSKGGFVLRDSLKDPWSSPRNLDDTMHRLRLGLLNADVYTTWYAKALRDGFSLRIRKIDTNPAKIVNTPGTQAVDIIVGTTVNRFRNINVIGIFACRNISGTSSWSQHAWANAVDYGGSTEVLNGAAHYLYNLTRAGYVPAAQILWRGENMLSGNAVSGHYDHIHVTGRPVRTGTPPCA